MAANRPRQNSPAESQYKKPDLRSKKVGAQSLQRRLVTATYSTISFIYSSKIREDAMDPRITYFPVGNGDCSLITLSDNTQIIIDWR